MQYNIYLLKNFNNYYNRKVKKFDTLNEYLTGNYDVRENINISIENGIQTEVFVNYTTLFDNLPDYALIEERDTGKFTRWFVLDSQKIRGNQYKLSLKRDSVADYFENFITSDCYIEKGYHNNGDAKYNKEPYTFNKIKTRQVPLYDELETPWIVGYIDKTTAKNNDIEVETGLGMRPDFTVANIVQEDIWKYSEFGVQRLSEIVRNDLKLLFLPTLKGTNNAFDISYSCNLYGADTSLSDGTAPWTNRLNYKYRISSSPNRYNFRLDNNVSNDTSLLLNMDSIVRQIKNFISGKSYILQNQLVSAVANKLNISNDMSKINDFKNNYNGKYIKDTRTNKIYYIKISEGTEIVQDVNYTELDVTLWNTVNSFFPSSFTAEYGTITFADQIANRNKDGIRINVKTKGLKIELIEQTTGKITITNSRTHSINNQYDSFAIPLKSVYIKTGLNTNIITNSQVSIQLAQAIGIKLDSACYDIQIVPYCPIRSAIKQSDGNYILDVTTLTKDSDYIDVKNSSNQVVNIVFWLQDTTEQELDLQYRIELDDIKEDIDLKEYRISSPNFSSQFEFSAGKNNGVNKFKFSYDYKPYNSYIRVWPEFNGLYGDNYTDARGMIYTGDMSVTQFTDQWVKYQLENKNYQKTFDREIQSMEKQLKWQKAESWVKVFAGSMQGGGTGAAAGMMVGGPAGAIAGAAIGGVASIGGGIADIAKTYSLGNDALDKAKTLFNYQLENIQALPNTINKMTSITVDNLGVPLLEIYEPLESEVVQYHNLIDKYGMTIMRVGTVLDYTNPYKETFVQGSILRYNEELIESEESADNTLVKDLSAELQKGIYIGG